MKIAIDCGHGIHPDIGATGNGLQEDDLVLKVGTKLQQLLEHEGHQVVQVRPSKTSSVNNSLYSRAVTANQSGADLFVSLHFNAFSKPSANGTETWIFSNNSTAKPKAQSILKELCDLGYRNRGVKVGEFAVLRHTNMPAVLVEIAFITNKDDMTRFEVDETALAIASGILGEDIDLPSSQPCRYEVGRLIVKGATYLKPSTEQSSEIDASELYTISSGEYQAELHGEEEGHFMVRFPEKKSSRSFDFIFAGHAEFKGV